MPQSAKISTSAGDWRVAIGPTTDSRCDLDVLLKDCWPHRVPVRDLPDTFDPTERRVLVPDCHGNVALLHSVDLDDRMKLSALALIVFHRVLDAYGRGSTTAIGFVNALAASGRGSRARA